VIGLSGALSARHRGYRVLLLGRHDSRLEKVKSLGIDVANSRRISKDFLQDFQPYSVIDTVQNQEAFDLYFPALPATWAADSFKIPREGIGEIVYSGHSPDGVTSWADMAHLQKQELTVHFVSGWTKSRIEATLELMRIGALPIEQIATNYQAEASEISTVFGNISVGKSPDLASAIAWE
jgi:D-arabinose 1-dehydrogenase-like Zn-dependent alcohol dehydrogenase